MQAAINAAATFLPRDLPNPPIYSKTNPADAPILTLALTSTTLPLLEGRGPRRHAAGAEDLAASGRRPGQHQRRPEAGGARSRRTRRALAAYGLSLEDVRTALARGQRQPGQGQLRRPASGVHDRRQRSAALERRLPAADRRLPQRRAGPPLRRRHRRRRRRERAAGGVDERDAGGDRQHPAAAGREHHRRSSTASSSCCRSCRRRCPPSVAGRDPDRPHDDHPRLGERRAVRADADHRAGRDGDLPVPADALRRP